MNKVKAEAEKLFREFLGCIEQLPPEQRREVQLRAVERLVLSLKIDEYDGSDEED